MSLDYVIVLSGEMELELDGDMVPRLNFGDTIVQRGTNYIWRNLRLEVPSRIIVCMIEAAPVAVDGTLLAQTPTWRMLVSTLRSSLIPIWKRAPLPDAMWPVADPSHVRRTVTGHYAARHAVVLVADEVPVENISDATDGATI